MNRIPRQRKASALRKRYPLMNLHNIVSLTERLSARISEGSAASSKAVKIVCICVGVFTFALVGFDALSLKYTLTRDPTPARKEAPSLTPPTAPALSLTELASMHMMGIPISKPKPAEPSVKPKPNVDVRLVGTITDSEPGLASALISVAGAPAARVFVGEAIFEEMKLQAVFDDRVEYTHDGTTLRLHFPFSGEQSAPEVPSRRRRRAALQDQISEAPNASADAANARETLKRFRALKGNNDN